MTTVRIGQGLDAHRFAAGRPLKLCGVLVPGEVGLEGHSDADVALHAVTDALFGALAAGDLGTFFPSSEERWRDADSRVLLERAVELAGSGGWRLVNLDLTIVGERPRVAPHRAAFRRSLADLLAVDLGRISVKATTTDGMGWTGRGEGLAALAVVLIERSGDGAAGAV